MCEFDRPPSRRVFGAGLLSGGLVAAGVGLIGGRALAQGQVAPTPESPMGPFYPIQRPAEEDADLVWLKGRSQKAAGAVIEVSGRVLDSKGRPIQGAVLEIWQANAVGRYAHPNDVATAALDPNFQGYAKIRTGASGEWRITTIKPAAYDSPIGRRTPHIHFDISGRAHRLPAQMYFADDAAQNATDPLFKDLGPDAPRSVAALAAPARYRWDVVLMDS